MTDNKNKETLLQIQWEVERLQQDSNALKAEIQQKKLDQQEQIKKKAEIDKRVSEIQGRLDVVDATTQEEITQKENLSNAVSGVQTDLSNLAQEVVDTSNTASSTLIENDSAVVEEKSWWAKTKDWVGDQWSSVRSKEKWGNETGRNIARSVWFVATGYGLYKGIKWLWNWAFGDKDEKKDGKSTEKKKGFWKTGFGKFVKWAGIGVWAFFGIRALVNYFSGNGDPETSKNPTDKVNSNWEKLQKESPEKANQCTEVGISVNDCWAKTILQNPDWRLENDLLGETNNQDFVFDKAPGAIIANMDLHYSSVGDLLNKSDYLSNMLQHAVNKPVYNIMSWWEEKINGLLKWLAGVVTGILPSFWWSDGKLTEEAKQELAKPNPDRDQQLHNIFSKYMRVKLWYQVKLQQLREKLAKDQLWPNATSEEIEDYLDDEKNRALVDAIIESKFVKVGLVQAAQYLKEKGILDATTLPENMQEVITDINDDYRKYRSTDIDKVLKNNESPTAYKESLSKSCNDFIYELQQPAVKRNLVEGVWHAMGADILFNNKGVDIETVAGQMGFNDILAQYTSEIMEISQKLSNGTATKEDIQHLNDLMNSFRMLQIEITLGGQVKNEADGKWWFTSKVTTRFWEWALHFFVDEDWSINRSTVGIVAGAYVLRKPIKFITKPVIWPLKKVGKWTVWLLNPARYGATRSVLNALPTGSYLRAVKYRWGEKQLKRFQNDIDAGRLSLKKARKMRPKIRSSDLTKHPLKFDDYLIKHLYPGKTLSEIETMLKWKRAIDTWLDVVNNSKIGKLLQTEIDDLTRQLSHATKGSPTYTRIESKLNKIDDLKKSLKTMSVAELDDMSELRKVFKTMNRGARGFDDVISLLGNAKKIFAAAELKGVSVDLSDLRRLKNIGLIDDSAIEWIARMMDTLKLQKLSKNFDELAPFFIKGIKLLAKLT